MDSRWEVGESWTPLTAAQYMLKKCRKAKTEAGVKQTHKVLSCHVYGPQAFIDAVKAVEEDLKDCQNIETMTYRVTKR